MTPSTIANLSISDLVAAGCNTNDVEVVKALTDRLTATMSSPKEDEPEPEETAEEKAAFEAQIEKDIMENKDVFLSAQAQAIHKNFDSFIDSLDGMYGIALSSKFGSKEYEAYTDSYTLKIMTEWLMRDDAKKFQELWKIATSDNAAFDRLYKRLKQAAPAYNFIDIKCINKYRDCVTQNKSKVSRFFVAVLSDYMSCNERADSRMYIRFIINNFNKLSFFMKGAKQSYSILLFLKGVEDLFKTFNDFAAAKGFEQIDGAMVYTPSAA